METTTKKDLIRSIASKSGLKKNLVKKIIEMLFDEIKSQYQDGKNIEIRKFGHFYPFLMKSRPFVIPSTGQCTKTSEYTTIKFRASSHMALRKG